VKNQAELSCAEFALCTKFRYDTTELILLPHNPAPQMQI